MTYQQPPDDPYQQQSRPSFTPYQQGQPAGTPPRGQQRPYGQAPEPYYGQSEIRPAAQDQRAYPSGRQNYPSPPHQVGRRGHRQAGGKQYALRGAESFWYVLMCIPFGAGYFAKVWAKKALWEIVGMVRSAPGEHAAAICRTLSGAAPYASGF